MSNDVSAGVLSFQMTIVWPLTVAYRFVESSMPVMGNWNRPDDAGLRSCLASIAAGAGGVKLELYVYVFLSTPDGVSFLICWMASGPSTTNFWARKSYSTPISQNRNLA